jgi:hypothetical protein
MTGELLTDRELDMACAFLVVKSAVLFFEGAYGIPESEPIEGHARRFAEKWREIPLERREAATIEVQRQLWQGLLDSLLKLGPKPGETPYQQLIREGAAWRE